VALLLADAGDSGKAPHRGRSRLGERPQGGIAEHDVRGLADLAGGLRTPRAERLEQRAVAFADGIRGGARLAGAAGADPPDGVLPERHRRLAAHHTAGDLTRRERAVLPLRDEDAARQQLPYNAAPVLIGQV